MRRKFKNGNTQTTANLSEEALRDLELLRVELAEIKGEEIKDVKNGNVIGPALKALRMVLEIGYVDMKKLVKED